jgi:hypothetical protein
VNLVRFLEQEVVLKAQKSLEKGLKKATKII